MLRRLYIVCCCVWLFCVAAVPTYAESSAFEMNVTDTAQPADLPQGSDSQESPSDIPLGNAEVDETLSYSMGLSDFEPLDYPEEPQDGHKQPATSWLEAKRPARWLGDAGVEIGGWVAQGFTYNAESPPNNSNFPMTFNDRANEYQLNQVYLTAERSVVRGGCQWDVGGRVDLLYGSDYYFTTALGLETHANGAQRWNSSGPRGAGPGAAALYGLALPQLYGELYAPLAGGLNVRVGHFYSPLGAERATAPDNFFYSHAYSRQYAQPMTLTGAMAEYHVTDNLDAVAGADLGWNRWDTSDDRWGMLAGLQWNSTDDRSSVGWLVHTGEDGAPGVNHPGFFSGPPRTSGVTTYSLVAATRIACRWKYVFQHDLGWEQSGKWSAGAVDDAIWYGISQHLIYSASEKAELGLRVEWFRDEDHARVMNLAPISDLIQGGNYVGLTAGLNWTPRGNILIRPEIRWDWSDTEVPVLGVDGPYDFFSKDQQLTAAFDLIVRF